MRILTLFILISAALSTCTTNLDCKEHEICSRELRECISLPPAKSISHYGSHKDVLNPVTAINVTIDEIIEFGRLIEEYVRVNNCDEQNILNWDCAVCNNDTFTQNFNTVVVANCSSWDTLAFAGYSEEYEMIIISFRGTKGVMDSLLDASFWKTTPTEFIGCDGCLIEFGFNYAYHTLSPKILDAVELMVKKYPTFRLISTGHSLGGGLASLGAVDIAVKLNITPELYTFAQVRVGNQNYINFLESKIKGRYRFVHKHDLVPHLPLIWMNFYQHGPEIWQQLDGSYKMCIDGEDKTCSNSLLLREPSDHCQYLDLPICHCDFIQVSPDLVALAQ